MICPPRTEARGLYEVLRSEAWPPAAPGDAPRVLLSGIPCLARGVPVRNEAGGHVAKPCDPEKIERLLG